MHLRNLLPCALLLTLGCNANSFLPSSSSSVSVTGNWQFASAAAVKLPSLSGELTGSGSTITGIVHADSATACLSPSTPIDLTGTVDARNLLTLTGTNLDGGTLTIAGTLAPDGKSLSAATYSVTGGACAFAAGTPVNAQAYTSISGSYAGTFADASGPVITIAANLTQTPASDTSGNFQLSGSATFGANPCFSSPVNIASSQVTGGAFTLTYADANTGNSVTASGTFTPDGTTLNVTNWTLTGSCGPDSGTGTLTRQ